MRYTKWIVILVLVLGACSERSAPPAAATSAKPAGAPETAAPAAPAGQVANPQVPNPMVAAAPSPPPSDPTPAPDMKPKYRDKAALLADIQAVKPAMQVDLDGQTVSSGFGPAMRYRTGKDGSISR